MDLDINTIPDNISEASEKQQVEVTVTFKAGRCYGFHDIRLGLPTDVIYRQYSVDGVNFDEYGVNYHPFIVEIEKATGCSTQEIRSNLLDFKVDLPPLVDVNSKEAVIFLVEKSNNKTQDHKKTDYKVRNGGGG